MKMTFDTPEAASLWRAVNDGVMGGRSSGGPEFADGMMVFEGVINTNGGGFSSVRADMELGRLSAMEGLGFRVKSDGRTYKVTLKSDARYRFRPVSFQAQIPTTPAGEWAEVRVPFKALKPSLFGRQLQGFEFNPAKAEEIGIIIADGTDGPFRLEIEWITADRE